MPEQYGSAIKREFWTAKEAAAHIGVTVNTLRAYVSRRTNTRKSAPRLLGPPPPSRKFGSSIRFPIEQFKKWALGPYGQNARKRQRASDEKDETRV